MQSLQRGRVYSSADDHLDQALSILCNTIKSPSKCFVFTRRIPRRIQESGIHPDGIKWMTERDHPDAILPSLEHLFGEINSILETGFGYIWIEGLGVLVHMQGFDSTLKFVRRIVDAVRGTNYSVLLRIDPLTISETELVRIRRECPNLKMKEISGLENNIKEIENKFLVVNEDIPIVLEDDSIIPNLEQNQKTYASSDRHIEMRINPLDIVLPPLLSKLPPNALDDSMIERRTEQWVLQGFDVTRMELALKLTGEERSRVYLEVEESIRRAIDCLRRIIRLERPRFSGTIAKLSFRAFQLTALAELEKELDLLEVAGHL